MALPQGFELDSEKTDLSIDPTRPAVCVSEQVTYFEGVGHMFPPGSDLLIKPLATSLEGRRQRMGKSFTGHLNIFASRALSEAKLTRVLYSAGQAGFSNFVRVVVRQSPGRPMPWLGHAPYEPPPLEP